MPTTTIPLVGEFTQRGLNAGTAYAAGKDQKLINCLISLAQNEVTKSTIPFVEKRPGFISIGNSTRYGSVITGWDQDPSKSLFASSTSAALTAGNLYLTAANSVGTFETGATVKSITSFVKTDTIFSTTVQSTYYVITTDNNLYYIRDAYPTQFTFTGNTSSGSAIVSSIAGLSPDTGVLDIGNALSGTGIPVGARVLTIDSATQITMTANATANGSGVTITREIIAKVIDADAVFTELCGGAVEMDGYVFALDRLTGRIYNSDLNNINSWSPNNYIPTVAKGLSAWLIKAGNKLLAFKAGGIDFYQNEGNPSGSPLSRINGMSLTIGSRITLGDIPVPVCQLGDDTFFVGSGTGGLSIYLLRGTDVSKISNPIIDNILDETMVGSGSGSLVSSISASQIGGYKVLCLSGNALSSTARNWFYFIDSNTWVEGPSFSGLRLGYGAQGNNCFAVSRTANSKDAYKWAIETGTLAYQDNGSAFTMTIQTEPKVLNKGKGFKIDSIELLADTQSSGETTLEISRDDYGTWQVLGVFNLAKTRKRITRCGYCRSSAAFRLSDAGNNAWRGQALIVNHEPCAA